VVRKNSFRPRIWTDLPIQPGWRRRSRSQAGEPGPLFGKLRRGVV